MYTRLDTNRTGSRRRYLVELRFETPLGTIQEKKRVEKSYYDAHYRNQNVPVYYLPETPRTFELTPGKTLDSGWYQVFTGIAIIGISLIGIAFYFYRARRALGLLQTGQLTDAKVYDFKTYRGSTRMRYGFTPDGGKHIEKMSLPRAETVFSGLKPMQTIPVYYDPKKPTFAFWLGDIQ